MSISRNRNVYRYREGFTLVELLVTVAILGIVAAIAIPSMKSTIGAGSVKSLAEQLIADINFARSEAIRTNNNVAVSFVKESSGAWCYGLSSGSAGCSCATANSCDKVVDQDDFSNAQLTNFSLSSKTKIVFDPQRATLDSAGGLGGTITLSSNGNNVTINLSLLGRGSACSATVVGLPAC